MKKTCLALSLLLLLTGAAVSEEYLSFVNSPDGKKIMCDICVDEAADSIIVKFNTNAEDVKISISPEFSDECAFTKKRVSAGECASVRVYIPDTIPNLCLSFTPEGGDRQSVWISQSGEDGSLIFIDIQPYDLSEWFVNTARALALEAQTNNSNTIAPIDENTNGEIYFTDDFQSADESVAAVVKYIAEPAGFSKCLVSFTPSSDLGIIVTFERAGAGVVKATTAIIS